jgi:ATP-dependent protease HslVU (ClpYQ) peptidase subunit
VLSYSRSRARTLTAKRRDWSGTKRDVFENLPAKVTVPRKTAELRVTGLEDSITPEEVAAALVEAGGCYAAEVSEGVIRAAPRGLGVAALPADSSKEDRRQ